MAMVARLISAIFHPIFMLNYMLVLLYLVNPYLFGFQDNRQRGLIFISVFILSVFFPIFSIFILKVLGFIKSIEMKDKTERVVPLILTSIFYLWLFMNIRHNSFVPQAFTIFVLGATISLFVAFFINNFSKISLHTIAAGGLVAVTLLIRNFYSYMEFPLSLPFLGSYNISLNLILFMSLFIAGIVGSARLFLSAHRASDVYSGYMVGFLGQLLAFRILFEV